MHMDAEKKHAVQTPKHPKEIIAKADRREEQKVCLRGTTEELTLFVENCRIYANGIFLYSAFLYHNKVTEEGNYEQAESTYKRSDGA